LENPLGETFLEKKKEGDTQGTPRDFAPKGGKLEIQRETKPRVFKY